MSGKEIELGVFLPIGNGGWIMSKNTPLHFEQIYDYNRTAAQIADRVGMDFVMSMAKWRGYEGATEHWSRTLESMTMMCGLAEATERVGVWATMHTTAHHPLVVAKQLTTLDQISHGRAGMNIVVGSRKLELEQLGLWGPQHLEHDDRYRFTKEWFDVIEGVWASESFDYEGEFFSLEDVQLKPAPSTRPRIICAGNSDVGLDFTTSRADGAFVSGSELPVLGEQVAKVHRLAAEKGRDVKAYMMLTLVIEESDAEADRTVAHIQEGADLEGVKSIAAAYRRNPSREDTVRHADVLERRAGFNTEMISGGPETIREKLEELLVSTGLDGVMFTFADYHKGLEIFGTEVLQKLRSGVFAPPQPVGA